MARKALKIIKYDAMQRGTNDFIPVTFMRQVAVDPETGKPLAEPMMVPFDLTGRMVMLTVKRKEYDGVVGSKTQEIEVKDESTPDSDIIRSLQRDPTGPWDKDYLFRITIDCDDPSEGADGPADDWYPWQNNYQGMYDMDPADGRVVFRITKKMTMIKPGTYYFDIRMMEKVHKQIGMIQECRDWAPIFGMFDIQGTPTNRAPMYDWEGKEEP